jgi:hypothetical protein
MSAITVRVPWVPPPSMNINAHTHWRRKHPDEQNAHMLAYAVTTQTRPPAWTVPDMPVMVVVIHWPKGRRRRDADNALGSAKWLTDGVCKALGFDDRQLVTSMAFQKRDKDGAGYVDITIRPATLEERRLAA